MEPWTVGNCKRPVDAQTSELVEIAAYSPSKDWLESTRSPLPRAPPEPGARTISTNLEAYDVDHDHDIDYLAEDGLGREDNDNDNDDKGWGVVTVRFSRTFF
ncbi:hypothetical protein K435DRAFT_851182 [Dendrothele bispora CBS 962.96]|uniref:Uncharacterized protein n=1 Tax=Dendrothele bispora (strain CBS 962.96) TaxID=1314807 RepID=A0A4S8MN90_DENBC|nr:hypothetical protein K435DRAFT_851182 [Dendrothele bispora CBS 962.96]